jgi:hypothetical protein
MLPLANVSPRDLVIDGWPLIESIDVEGEMPSVVLWRRICGYMGSVRNHPRIED